MEAQHRRAACSRHAGCRVLIPPPEEEGGGIQNAGEEGGFRWSPSALAAFSVRLWRRFCGSLLEIAVCDFKNLFSYGAVLVAEPSIGEWL